MTGLIRPFKKSQRPGFLRMKSVLAALAVGFALLQDLSAQTEKKIAIAGARYAKAPGGQEWILGHDYRDLWATPIEVEVLNLKTFAGGLKPVMRVGGRETLGLAMKGQDGRDYTFRGVDKSVSGVVPEEFLGTAVEDIAQDQVAGGFPAAGLVVSALAHAVGVLDVDSRLVVMPDDPSLGEFQKEFAGVLGVFMEYPGSVSDTNPGFLSSTEIIGHPAIWQRLNERPELRVDSRAFLRARLLDILIGDWDRHRKQWRWARIPGERGLQPIPEDRDQAFSDYEGVAMGMARMRGATFLKFEKKYPSVNALTIDGWDVDRYLLTDIEKPEWMRIAREVQSRVTDEVIENALRRMPPEYYKLRGSELASTLKARRDQLTAVAESYYRLRSAKVDIYATAASERVVIEQLNGGDVEVQIATLEAAPDQAYYRRKFKKDETKEIRIYLQGGDDRVETRGGKGGGIAIRVIGGPGNDVVNDSGGRGVDFYDSEGNNRIEGGHGTSLRTKPFVITGREDEVPEVPRRDWGRFTKPLFVVGFHPDPGLILGAGVDTEVYGFRKYPWASRHILTGGFATTVKRGFLNYEGDYRRENSWLHGALHVRASGIDQLRYYGSGNETPRDRRDEFSKVSDTQLTVFPALAITHGTEASFEFGPILKYSDTGGTRENTVLAEQRPYGIGKFGEAGFKTAVWYDGTDPKNVLGGGVQAKLAGTYYAKTWDVERQFGSLEGEFTGNVPLGEPAQLSLRAGGKKLWGNYPFYEAAYVGGSVIQGYNWNRFAGDASLYSTLGFKWAFAQTHGTVPMEIGLSLGSDAGRVWRAGENSSRWHTGVASGIFISPFSRLTLFEIGVGKSQEKTFLVFGANLRIAGF